jgi:pimeloyl-ACP methyl ester carboxylesterase
MYRYLQSRTPRSELYIVSESGHSVYWEQPNTFNQIVLEFLNRYKILAGWRAQPVGLSTA